MEKIIFVNDLLIERAVCFYNFNYKFQGISFDEHQQQITKERLKTHKVASKAEQISTQKSVTETENDSTAPLKKARLSSEVASISLNSKRIENSKIILPHKKCVKNQVYFKIMKIYYFYRMLNLLLFYL